MLESTQQLKQIETTIADIVYLRPSPSKSMRFLQNAQAQHSKGSPAMAGVPLRVGCVPFWGLPWPLINTTETSTVLEGFQSRATRESGQCAQWCTIERIALAAVNQRGRRRRLCLEHVYCRRVELFGSDPLLHQHVELRLDLVKKKRRSFELADQRRCGALLPKRLPRPHQSAPCGLTACEATATTCIA